MKRLFAFGCSFTNYVWPTWADILGKSFDHYENWGQSGAGNLFIAASVSEAHARRQITENDTVIIMWTNVAREDRYVNGWVTPGNIHTQSIYDDNFIRNHVTDRGCYVRDFAVMNLTKKLLDGIGCKYIMLSMVDMNNPRQYEHSPNDSVTDVFDVYHELVNVIRPSVHKTIFNYDWFGRSPNNKYFGVKGFKKRDPHPTPLEHLEYIDIVMPELDISPNTRDWLNKYNDSMELKKYFNQTKIMDRF